MLFNTMECTKYLLTFRSPEYDAHTLPGRIKLQYIQNGVLFPCIINQYLLVLLCAAYQYDPKPKWENIQIFFLRKDT